MNFRSIAISIILIVLCCGTLQASEESLITVKTRGNKSIKCILVKSDHPVAIVLLFPGGHGSLGLFSRFGTVGMEWGGKNFLVRTRKMFARSGLMVAVVDAPSDRNRMNALWRMSRKHGQDVSAVIEFLKRKYQLPVWVAGTSMGTFSAVNAAIRSGSKVSGLVLTSSITRSLERWKIYTSYPNGIIDLKLDVIRVPVLIVSHKNDRCMMTPAADSRKLEKSLRKASRVKILNFSGGKRPVSKPCRALSAHGFYGIEKDVVSAIVKFIKAER